MTEYVPAGAPRAAESRMAFRLDTVPTPVRVSPGTGDTEYAKITAVGSVTDGEKITLNEITVKVLAGSDSPTSPPLSPEWSRRSTAPAGPTPECSSPPSPSCPPPAVSWWDRVRA